MQNAPRSVSGNRGTTPTISAYLRRKLATVVPNTTTQVRIQFNAVGFPVGAFNWTGNALPIRPTTLERLIQTKALVPWTRAKRESWAGLARTYRLNPAVLRGATKAGAQF